MGNCFDKPIIKNDEIINEKLIINDIIKRQDTPRPYELYNEKYLLLLKKK